MHEGTEPHFRSGIKRMHIRCYEERVKPKPPRAGAHPKVADDGDTIRR